MFRLARRVSRKWSLEERRVLIERAKSAVVQLCHPVEIYIFGSALSDAFDDSSDLDLIIVFATEKEAQNSWRLRSQIRRQVLWPLDLIAFSKETFDLKKHIGGIAAVAFSEGKLIYSKEQASGGV